MSLIAMKIMSCNAKKNPNGLQTGFIVFMQNINGVEKYDLDMFWRV